MKNRDRIKIALIGIFSVFIIGGILLGLGILSKSLALDEGIDNITAYVDENNNPTDALLVFENINYLSKLNVSGNTYTFSTDDNITLTYSNPRTHEEITPSDNKITIGEDGLALLVNNLEKGNVYTINVTADTHKKGYSAGFKKAVIKLDYTGILTASLDKLYDENNNQISLDDNDKLILVYSTENEKIRLRANPDTTILYYFSRTELSDEELNNVNWTEYNKETYLFIDKNGYLYSKARFKTEGYSNIAKLVINNIDKLNPVLTVNSKELSNNNTEVVINYTVDDHEADQDNGKSGLKAYYFSDSIDNDESRYINVTDGVTTTATVNENGTYYVHAIDNAGNIVAYPIEVDNIPEAPAEDVLLVLSSPKAELVGKTYTSFTSMKNAFASSGITSNDEVVVQVIKNIKRQKYNVENVNLILDLNGYEVSNNTNDPTITVSNGATLTLLDNKYTISNYFDYEHPENNPEGVVLENIDYSAIEHGSNYGAIKNDNNAILVQSGGHLVLGEETSPDPAHIEYPDHNAPYIFGQSVGIVNNGEFDYFDGKIKGELTIDGDYDETPRLYGPNVVLDDGTDYTVMTLEILTNIEARIGRTTYTLLENAIDAANNYIGTSNDQIKIYVLKDIVKDFTLEIPSDKNIIIDFNGFSYSGTVNGDLIHNYGRTVLMNSYDMGSVTCTPDGFIVNEMNASLTIDSGSYTCAESGNITNIIDNKIDATLTINNGTFTNTEKGNVIDNNGGIITINNGTFTGNVKTPAQTVINNYDKTGKEGIKELIVIDPTSIVSTEEYGFVTNGTGVSSNNQGVGGSTAYGYYHIDLTNKDANEVYDLVINTTVGSERNWDYGYIALTNSTDKVEYSDSNTKSYLGSGVQDNIDTTIELHGGNEYYVHFGYRKDGSGDSNGDTFTINSIKVQSYEDKYGRITINGGSFSGGYVCYNNTSTENYNEINGGTFDCTQAVRNADNAKMTINNGTFRNGSYNYKGNLYINGGTFNNLYNMGTTNTTGGTYSYIYNGFLLSSGYSKNYVYNSDGCYLNLSGATVDRIENYYSANISNTTINNSLKYLNSNAKLVNPIQTLDNVTINNTLGNIDGSRNTFEISRTGMQMFINKLDLNLHADMTSYTTDRYLNGIAINSNDNDIYFSDSSIDMSVTGDHDLGTNYEIIKGIYNNSNTNLYFVDTEITTTTNRSKLIATGILNKGKGNITLGTKDDTYNRDSNIINSTHRGIKNYQGQISLYDGYLKGTEYATDGIIGDVETNYYLHSYTEDDYKIIDLTNISPNNIINTRTSTTYGKLSTAIDEAQSNDTLKFIGDYNYEGVEQGNEVPSGKNINIDLNGKEVHFGGGLINNGVLKIIDSSSTEAKVYSHSIINNNNMEINAGNWVFEINLKSAVINNGRLSVSSSKYKAKTTRRSYIFDDSNNFIMNDGTYIYFDYDTDLYANVTTENTSYPIISNYGANTVINGGTIHSDLPNDTGFSSSSRGIETYGGHITINGGNFEYTMLNSFPLKPDYYIRTCATYELCSEKYYNRYALYGADRSLTISSTANNTYPTIVLDLTSYSGNTTINVDYVKGYYDPLILNEDLYETNEGLRPTVNTEETFATFEVTGGKTYYLHLSKNTEVSNITIVNGGVSESLWKYPTVDINGGKFDFSYINILASTLNISDVLIENTNVRKQNSTYGITASNSTVNTTGGTIKNLYRGIYLTENSTASLKNINIISDNEANYIGSTSILGINIDETSTATLDHANMNMSVRYDRPSAGYSTHYDITNSGNLTITDSNIRIDTNQDVVAILVNKGDVNISSSTISATSVTENTSQQGINQYNGTVTISNNDNDVSTTTSDITGGTYALYRTRGTLNYYDGILRGKEENIIYGGISDKPDGYEFLNGNDGTYNTIILYSTPVIRNLLDNSEYPTIERGFDSCTDNVECNLLLLTNVSFNRPNTLPANKIVNLNLGEHSIVSASAKNLINKGNLTLTNGSVEAGSIDDNDAVIINEGTLTVSTGAVIDSVSNLKSRLIYNKSTGKVYVNGGEIKQDTKAQTGGAAIYNEAGYVEFNSGTFIFTPPTISASVVNRSKINEELSSYESDTVLSFASIDLTNYVPLNLESYSGNVDVKVSVRGIDDYIRMQSNTTTVSNKLYAYDYVLTSFNSNASPDLEFNADGTQTLTLTGGKTYYLYLIGGQNGFVSDLKVEYNNESKSIYKRGKIVYNDVTLSAGTQTQTGTINSSVNSDFEFNGTSSNIYGTFISGGINSNITVSNVAVTGALNFISLNNSDGVVNTATAGTANFTLITSYSNLDVTGLTGTGTRNGSSFIGSDVTIRNSSLTASLNNNTRAPSDYSGTDTVYAGVHSSCSNVTLENTTVTTTSIKDNYTNYGISITGRSTFTIGVDDGTLNNEANAISGHTIGILKKSPSTLTMYDGRVKAKTAVSGLINTIADNSNIIETTEDSKDLIYLVDRKMVKNNVDNSEYYNLSDAINSCTDNVECNLTMLNDAWIVYESEISQDKIINLNLGGYTIKSSKDGAIINKGKLSISNGGIRLDNVANTSFIINHNEVNLESDFVYNADIYSSLVYNDEGAVFNINDGSYQTGKVSNTNNGEIVVNGGTFASSASITSIPNLLDYENNKYYTTIDITRTNTNPGDVFIPLDLTDFEGEVTITVDYQYSVSNRRYSYLYIYNEAKTQANIITSNNSSKSDVITTTVQGGNKYWFRIALGLNCRYKINQLTMSNGTKKDKLIKNAKLTINDVTVTTNNTQFVNANRTDVVVNGGTYYGYSTSMFYSSEYSSVEINDGQFNFRNSIVSTADLIINGGTYTPRYPTPSNHNVSSYPTIYMFMATNATINDFEFNYTSSDEYEKYGVLAVSNNLIVNNMDVNLQNVHNSSFVLQVGSNSIIYDANINTNAIAINSLGYQGDLVLGVNDGEVSKTNPLIKGDAKGINDEYSVLSIRFFDGKVQSDGNIIYGNVAEVPQDYHVVQIDNYYVLDPVSSLDNTYEYNGIFFQSLDLPINMISRKSDKTGTIKVWNDSNINKQITIPSGVNITLALEGHTLTFDSVDPAIINNGTLLIIDGEASEIDSQTQSGITNKSGKVFDNNGSITLGATGRSNPSSPIIKGTSENTGNSINIVTGSVISNYDPLANMGKSIIRFFTSLFQPTYSYSPPEYKVNNLDPTVTLATTPNMRSVEDLTKWTNVGVNVGIASHNAAVMNLVEKLSDETKELKYTVEVYKDDVKVDDDSFVYVKNVQVLDNDYLNIDSSYFENAHKKYSGYTLVKVVQDEAELPVRKGVITIEESVRSGTVFKLYYKKIPKTVTSSIIKTKTVPTEPITDEPPTEPPTEPTTEETTTSSRRTTTTTEEVKGVEIVVVKKQFPWWILAVIAGILALIGLLIWLLPILLRKSVLIAISGSVGSAVAAKLLQERQCKVTALFINTGTNLQQLTYAKQVCSKLGIDLYEQEINGEYRTRLLEGITNNPNVDLDKIYNKYILIDMLKDVAKEQHIKYISTGIYARKEGKKIIPGVNQVFDESDKLSLLTEEDIKKLLLPLGEIEYQEITQIAESNNVNFNSQKQSAIDKIGNNNIPSEVIDKLNK